MATTLQILGDPNEIQVRVAAFPGLREAIAAVDVNSVAEQRNWRQRRMDNRTMLIRAVEKQFVEEMTFIKRIGQGEKAAKTVVAVDAPSPQESAPEVIFAIFVRNGGPPCLPRGKVTARARSK